MKSEIDVAARDRISVDVNDIKQRVESFRSDAAWRELSLAGKMRALVIEHMEQAEEAQKRSPVSASNKQTDAETLELLIGFLNYLLDHHDHDGYSLAEIGAILGRKTGDKDLIALIAKLQNGNAKTGVKPR
jgi:hypothetical protein